jgi:uncharacterized membrane protein YgdD (TMEM256/DUF423 family)
MKVQTVVAVAGFSGALAVILGALGAHALTNLLPKVSLTSFKTGVLYHLLHALLLIGVADLSRFLSEKELKATFYLLVIGKLLFSGSIYLLATKPIHGLEVSFLGPVTPIGGLLLISAWIFLAVSALRKT